MTQIAKLFKNGRSQAVRLPSAFRFEGVEVFIRRDADTGDVILSSKPAGWEGFLEAIRDLPEASDFLSPAERGDQPWVRDPFGDRGADD